MDGRKRTVNKFEDLFRREFSIDEATSSEEFLKALSKTMRQEPLMITLIWSLSGLTLRTTADLENAQAVRQLATNLRSVAEQLDSLAFNLITKGDKDDSESISGASVGEDK